MGHSRYQGLWAQGASWVNGLWSLPHPAKGMGVVDCQRLIVQKIYIFKIKFCLINYDSNMKSLYPGTQRNTRGKKLMIHPLRISTPLGTPVTIHHSTAFPRLGNTAQKHRHPGVLVVFTQRG